MLAGDSKYADRAAAFSSKVRDVSEFLDEIGLVAPMNRLERTVTYHDACHLAHAQGIADAPRRLIERIPGIVLVPLPESDVCCGSAGVYNLTQPVLAQALLERKVKNVKSTGASAVIAGNPGCMAWIANGLEGAGIDVLHPMTLLRRVL